MFTIDYLSPNAPTTLISSIRRSVMPVAVEFLALNAGQSAMFATFKAMVLAATVIERATIDLINTIVSKAFLV